jgi:hypothetical protein
VKDGHSEKKEKRIVMKERKKESGTAEGIKRDYHICNLRRKKYTEKKIPI